MPRAELSDRRIRNLAISFFYLTQSGLNECKNCIRTGNVPAESGFLTKKIDDLSSPCLAKGLFLLNDRFPRDQIIMSF